MSGRWSLVRLLREAYIDSEFDCLFWCNRIGLLSTRECEKHEAPLIIENQREDNITSASWECQECYTSYPVTAGTIFESSRVGLGKALVIIYCFANRMTYEDTRTCCIFRRDDPLVRLDTIATWFDKLTDITMIASGLEFDENGTNSDAFADLVWQIIKVKEASE